MLYFDNKKAFLLVCIFLFFICACTDNTISEIDNNKTVENSFVSGVNTNSINTTSFSSRASIPEGTWQGVVKFPDWKGYIDDTLAMNSMYSFDGYKDQGKLYFEISNEVQSFDLFINNKKVDTSNVISGTYEIDISKLTKNGTNTIQVSNITPNDLANAITVYVPYPVIIDGTLEEVGLSKEPFDLISKIIQADVDNGFPGAQLAVIKDGKLIYQNSWGYLNSYDEAGNLLEDKVKVTNDTLFDLASNTKMYSVAYAIQYLVENGKINLEDKIVDIIGKDFVDNTLEIKFASYGDNYPGFKKIKEWKSNITVKDVMMHRAGFPDSGHYHNEKFDQVNQKLVDDVNNLLFVNNANKEKTLNEGICKTPLIYEPNTKTMYSDIDYMLLGIIIEKVTGKDLNTFLKETYWDKIDLERITYNPLENGFAKEDCAATGLNGNTRAGLVDFSNVRKELIQGEVHDEECYYMMEGISGHAGLFANATDLAKLATVMLTGGYGNNKFFSKNIRDAFIAPQSVAGTNYGIGWWREADDKRVYYFGTQAPESTIGHQGWTGTLTMIDLENDLVVVLLTNSKNTPIINAINLDNANNFAGNYYTTATLGFVPQLVYMSLDNNDIEEALNSLKKDFVVEHQKLVDKQKAKLGGEFDENHPIVKAHNAILEAVK